MTHQPGQVMDAIVDGEKTLVYITLSELDVDGNPRWRYAPQVDPDQGIIEQGVTVEILGVFDRFK